MEQANLQPPARLVHRRRGALRILRDNLHPSPVHRGGTPRDGAEPERALCEARAHASAIGGVDGHAGDARLRLTPHSKLDKSEPTDGDLPVGLISIGRFILIHFEQPGMQRTLTPL